MADITGVKSDITQAVADQALNIFGNYQTTTNPRVQQIAKMKLQQYNPQAYQQMFGGGQAAGMSAQPAAPAAPKAPAPPPNPAAGTDWSLV